MVNTSLVSLDRKFPEKKTSKKSPSFPMIGMTFRFSRPYQNGRFVRETWKNGTLSL